MPFESFLQNSKNWYGGKKRGFEKKAKKKILGKFFQITVFSKIRGKMKFVSKKIFGELILGSHSWIEEYDTIYRIFGRISGELRILARFSILIQKLNQKTNLYFFDF